MVDEPACPAGRRLHHERVNDINKLLKEGQVGGIAIDNTTEHVAWYLQELAKYPNLKIEFHGDMSRDIYLIRVKKIAIN